MSDPSNPSNPSGSNSKPPTPGANPFTTSSGTPPINIAPTSAPNISTGGTFVIPLTQPVTWIFGPSIPVETIKQEMPAKKSEGCSCKKCKEYFPYAEPNQEDGSLICYSCRTIWR